MVDFFAAVVLDAAAFEADPFESDVFEADALEAVVLAPVDFFAAVVLDAVVFRVVVRFFAGPLARLSASSSNARVSDMPSIESSLRSVAFVVPSVT